MKWPSQILNKGRFATNLNIETYSCLKLFKRTSERITENRTTFGQQQQQQQQL